MPGMSTGLSTNNPAIVSAFQAALLHQGLIVLLILALVAVAWNVLRSAQSPTGRRRWRPVRPFSTLVPARPEPVARRLLRVSFGLIWVFDGILQGQASMPLGHGAPGHPARRRWPRRAGSSTWSTRARRSGATTRSRPLPALCGSRSASGLWLLAAPRGDWSRLAGLASVGLGPGRLGLR